MTNLSTYINIDGNQGNFTEVTGNTITGEGGNIANITGANVTGTVGTASVASTAYSVSGANVSGAVAIANTAYAVSGANVSGQVGNALVAGTVYTNAQPNITSVGTLTTLSVTGNVEAAGITTTGAAGNITGANVISANTFIGDGSQLTGMYSNTNVQSYLPIYSGLLGGTLTTASQPNLTSAGATFSAGNITANNLSISNAVGITGNLTVGGNVNFTSGNINQISGNAGSFFGDTYGFGALYAGIPSGFGNIPATVLQVSANYNDYAEFNIQNINGGTNATTDIVATADNGGIDSYYADFGITSSTFNGTSGNALGNILGPNDVYVYSHGANTAQPAGSPGNLVLATATKGTIVKIAVGGGNIANLVATFNPANTVSANTTSGALVIAGGVGVSGNLNAANVVGTSLYGTIATASQTNITALGTITALSAVSISTGNIQTTGNATIGGNLNVSGNINATGNINIISGNSGQFYGNTTTGFNALYAGTPSGYTLLPQEVTQFSTNFNGYTQVSSHNINSGNQSTSDFVATADTGTDSVGYIDMGIAGSGYNGAVAGSNNGLGTSVNPFDGYLYTQGNAAAQLGNLVLGTNVPGSKIKFISGGSNIANIALTISSPNTNTTLSVAGNVTATAFIGNGAPLTSITGANVTGQVGNALIAGTVYTNAQPNITSTGTLSTLSVTGNVSFGDNTLFYSSYTTMNGLGIFHSTGANPQTLQVSTNSRANGIALSTIGTANSLVVSTGGIEFIAGGTLNANTTPSGGTSVATITTGGLSVNGNVVATGNVSAGNLYTSGVLAVSTLVANGLSTPWSNAGPLVGNLIVQYGNSLLRTNGNIAAGAPFAYGNVGTANTFSYVTQWVPPTNNVYIDPNNGNDLWDGSINTPFKTMAAALAARLNIGVAYNLLPGTYTESITITDQNLNINGPGFGGGVNITGTWNFAHTASSIRVYGCSFNTLVFSGTGSLYLDNCLTNTVDVIGTGYFDVINSSMENGNVSLLQGTTTTCFTNITTTTFGNIDIDGNVTVNIFNSTASNANVTVEAGTLVLESSELTSPVANATVLTMSSGTVLIANNTTFADPDGTSSKVTVGGLWSFAGVNVDYANSTFTGTNFGEPTYYDNITVIGLVQAAAVTNTRVVPRINYATSSATITINADTTDQYDILALAVASTISAPTGTLTDGQKLNIRIRDNGISQTITWNAVFRVIGTVLPATTTAGKLCYVGCIYNQLDSKWDVVSVAQEA